MDLQGKKLVVFDCDGTLTQTITGDAFRRVATDHMPLPGRIDKLDQLHTQGVHLAMATNQGGVAFGYFSEADMLHELRGAAGWFKIAPEAVYVCFNHPKASIEQYRKDDPRRKPNPGMLLEAMRDFNVSPDETLMVGDRPEDEQAARNAGVQFCHADTFFATIKP